MNVLQRPLRKQYKAARMYPCVPKWLTAKTHLLHYSAAFNIAVDPNLDYRFMELGPGCEVLLVTPKGLSTTELKTELFDNGWVEFLKAHPDYQVHTVDKLGLRPVTWSDNLPEPILVFARSQRTGELRKTGVLYSRVELMGVSE